MPQPQQHGIWAVSATYTTARGNARSLTHWVRPGIQPVSSWMLVGFVTLSHDGNPGKGTGFIWPGERHWARHFATVSGGVWVLLPGRNIVQNPIQSDHVGVRWRDTRWQSLSLLHGRPRSRVDRDTMQSSTPQSAFSIFRRNDGICHRRVWSVYSWNSLTLL